MPHPTTRGAAAFVLTLALTPILFPAGGLAGQADAPDGATPGAYPELLPEAEEVRLARSAGPEELTGDADIWVLRRHGFERVVDGGNGWTCMVERDHPDSLAPLCYDPEGTRTLLPGVLRRAELRAGGMSYIAARDSVDSLYRSGALEFPARPVVSHMLAKEQRLYNSPTGVLVGNWRPHVMIFYPGVTAEEIGTTATPWPVSLGGADSAIPYMVIPVARWSDGSEAGG